MGIRLAAEGDENAIASVLEQAFSEHRSLYTEAAYAATVGSPEAVRGRMTEGPIWVAIQNEEVVGTVSAVLRVESVYVRGMAVLPSARGRRIGELLLDQAVAYAARHGRTSLVLSTTPFLARAIQLYRRFGFRWSDEGPGDLFGTPLGTMVKDLSGRPG